MVIASGLTWPIAITQDGGNVYVSAYVEGGGVYRIPKAGGEPIPVAAPLDFPAGLALDGTTLLVAESGGSRILRVGTDGQGLEALATGQGGPTAITLDDSRFFWTSYVGHHIVSMPQAGGTVTVLASPEGSPYRLAAGATTVAWSGIGPGLWSVPKQGGAMTQIAGGSPRTIVAEGARYYYNDTDDDTVRRVEEDGSDPAMLASLSAHGAFTEGLALDAEHAYVTLASGSVVRVPRAGGEAELLASGRVQPTAITVDRACVYWTEAGDTSPGSGSVVRAPK